MSTPVVCLVTSRHLCYNPRLLKEADALHEAGSEVRVVALNANKRKREIDRELMHHRGWRLDTLAVKQGRIGYWRWIYASLRQRLMQNIPSRFLTGAGFKRAYSRYTVELASRTASEPADLFIAHNLQALPPAHHAAEKHGSKLGFDAEDFHRGELSDKSSYERSLTERIEQQYIPRCDYVTAASDGIGKAYAEALDIEQPTTVLNVFPRSERSGHVPSGKLEREAPSDVRTLYWYSQTIGPDRGLQDALRALTRLDETVHLSLRGTWVDGFKERFRRMANDLQVLHRVHHLPPVSPEQLIERAGQHDIGLALEQAHTLNRDLCLTNKLFAYLLAGLPVIATNTKGQRRICEDLPDATRLCPVGAPGALADAVQSLLNDETTYSIARRAAWQAAEKRYNWEVEKEKFLATVESVL